MADRIFKHDLWWDPWMSPLEIEFTMIRHGGRFVVEGIERGGGLFQHYKNAQSLLWPDEDHHRWSDLILKTILEERLTVVQGSRDSGKTRGVSKFVLVDYFCFPFDTLTLMSSTDVRGLELRVWGDLKDLWDRALARFDWLPGNPVDSKHGIFTDALDDDNNLRDMRRGIICFVTGTMVDTPSGPRPIESLKPGDEVLNAIGIGTVKACSESLAETIMRVTLSDGRFVDCTPEHPFFTRRGWVKAVDLFKYDAVFSAYETVSLMQEAAWSGLSESEVLFKELPHLFGQETLRALRETFSRPSQNKSPHRTHRKILLGQMRELVDCGSPRTFAKGFHQVSAVPKEAERGSRQPAILFRRLPGRSHNEAMRGVWAMVQVTSARKDAARDKVLQRILQMEMEQPEFWKAVASSNGAREGTGDTDSDVAFATQDLYRTQTASKCASSVSSGFSGSASQAGNRNGWRNSPPAFEEIERPKEGCGTRRAWVDRVEILFDSRKAQSGIGEARHRVHNLQVGGHPSYSVNGIVVHNCVPVLDSEGNETKTLERFVGVKQKRRRLIADETQFLNPRYLNVLSNLDKGEFKAVFTGNPLGQQALDKVAEPECGWDNMPEPTKTTTWRNKFDGVTINLVGTDSPNFDADRPKDYDYLIDPADVERVKKRFGPDSIEFYSQIKGVRKAGMNMRLVLTPEMCRINGAYEPAVWAGTEITNVLGVDAGYGGDACETVFLQFGQDAQRRIIVKFHEPETITINLNSDVSPEDQIAIGVREKCEGLRVPPGNVAFEAGMRATLAVSFGRIFSGHAEAINAGGSATDRPVSEDLLVDDDEKAIGQKRLKRCNEHYSKFITEMWFSVRALVEARMARELPKSVVKEFSEREWIWARGTRYEMESKEDFKKRWNYSPNKADATAIAVEKARRLGLVISRKSEPGKQAAPDDWLEKEVEKHRQFMRKKELGYAH